MSKETDPYKVATSRKVCNSLREVIILDSLELKYPVMKTNLSNHFSMRSGTYYKYQFLESEQTDRSSIQTVYSNLLSKFKGHEYDQH